MVPLPCWVDQGFLSVSVSLYYLKEGNDRDRRLVFSLPVVVLHMRVMQSGMLIAPPCSPMSQNTPLQ